MWRKIPFLFVVFLLATACGEDRLTIAATDDSPEALAESQIEERLTRIVSLSSTSTEILFAIGAGEQVVAVDSLSDFPPEAPVTELSAWEPSVEAIASFEPDLVIVFFDPGDLLSGLEAIGIPVIHHLAATSLDDAYRQIEDLGLITGNREGALELIGEMQTRIEEIVTDYSNVVSASPITYYHEVDDMLYSPTSASFIGSIYSLFGLQSIADAADSTGSGFPQLNSEYIIKADPDVIFYGCALWCGTTADSIAARPGWKELTAVQRGAIVEVDDNLTSRWGPRVVDFVATIGASLESLLDS